ncbi:MAG: hypothetical protein EXR86_16725, partial [Gammaproteobacteria bacterium]|nr:hypothetical protein [Gammaproteobacteria bacterium]
MIDHKKSTLLATLSVGCVLTLFIAVWASGLWVASDRWGIGDWGCNTARLEAIRATVVEFGQWPGNNPWISGGLPLLGNPTLSLFSIPGVLSLFVGAHWGNQLAILLLIYIGWAGSWLLSGLWWKETWLRAVFSFYIIANPALIHHLTGGHLAFPNFYFLPAAFYFFLRWSDDPWSGLKAGAILGLAFLHSLAYMVQYAF